MNGLWKLANQLYKWGGVWTPIARVMELLSYIMCSNAVSAKITIGTGTRFYHRGVGCIVHPKTVIGKNCTIFQNVTLGSKWPKGICEGDAPVIGDNVLIGAGAVILGNVQIGSNAIIGANAVVTKDVPCNALAVGIPAVVKFRTE